jgi:hypothetical protein
MGSVDYCAHGKLRALFAFIHYKNIFILFELGVFICVARKMRLVCSLFYRTSPSCLTTLAEQQYNYMQKYQYHHP